jgi:hypothetical protein
MDAVGVASGDRLAGELSVCCCDPGRVFPGHSMHEVGGFLECGERLLTWRMFQESTGMRQQPLEMQVRMLEPS